MIQQSAQQNKDRLFRYLELADRLESQIRNGAFRAGEKLPSIRHLHSQVRLSISTVYQAFIELEKRGLVEPREKSGYFVKPLLENLLPSPEILNTQSKPNKVTVNNLAFALLEAMNDPEVMQLGGALIAPELLPGKELAAILKSISLAGLDNSMAAYGHPLGHPSLRRQIARHSTPLWGYTAPEEMVITNGCMEAVSICLQAVAEPGDTIVVESPTFPWFLQIIEDFGFYALEIPTDPHQGMDLKALDRAIQRHHVKACILITNFNNPLGFLMPDQQKKALLELLGAREIPIIEDDIYGELYFGPSRPAPLKAYDRLGLVLYCASFSKTLSPGLRVGWALPGRYLEKVRRLKLNQTICGPSLPQMVVAKFMQNGAYERHLRRLRTALKNQVSNMALAVARLFPDNTKISSPQGGLTLWVQLNPRVDSLELFRRALKARIAVLPGIICASSATYDNCIRISCGMPWNKRLEQGLLALASIVKALC